MHRHHLSSSTRWTLALALGATTACDPPGDPGEDVGGVGDEQGAHARLVDEGTELSTQPAAVGGPKPGADQGHGSAPEGVSAPGDVLLSIERPCDQGSCTTDTITVTLASQREDAVDVEVFLAGHGLDGRRADRRIDPGGEHRFTLLPHASTQFKVAAGDLPIQSVGSVSSLFAVATIFTADGSVPSQTAPLPIEHAADYASITAYTVADAGSLGHKRATAGLLAPQGRVYDGTTMIDVQKLPVQTGEGHTIDGGTTVVTAEAGGELPQYAPPPGPAPKFGVCFMLQAMYNDAGFGEDIDNLPPVNGKPAVQLVPAAYLHAELDDVDGKVVFAGHLDLNGCVPGGGLPPGKYTSWITPILVKPIGAKETAKHTLLHTSEGVDYNETWVDGFTLSGNTTVNITGAGWSPVMNVAAINARMFRINDAMLSGEENTIFVERGCETDDPGVPDTDSCANPVDGHVFIGPGAKGTPAQSLSKFLVAHEHGHLVEGRLKQLDTLDYHSGDDPTNAACRCDHVVGFNQNHCLQSREDYGIGFVEGFAHFYASMLYNARGTVDCAFVYYKPINAGFAGVLAPPVKIDCGQTFQWRDNHCTEPEAGQDTAVEMDYMRFLWSVYSQGNDRLSLSEIAAVADDAKDLAWAFGFQWEKVRHAAEVTLGLGSGKYLHFVDMANIHGIDDDYTP